jgi:hypothetical protein
VILTDLVLAFELSNEVVDETVVEVLTTQVSVTSSRLFGVDVSSCSMIDRRSGSTAERRKSGSTYLDLEDALLNGEERDIESTTTKIEDEDVALTLDLLVETVSDGSGGGLVDDAEDVQAGDETGILGSLTLRVVEVGGDGNNWGDVSDCGSWRKM